MVIFFVVFQKSEILKNAVSARWCSDSRCLKSKEYMSHRLRNPTICIGENKAADQLHGNREADQRLCFRYTDSTIPLLPSSEISRFRLSSVTVQAGLRQPNCWFTHAHKHMVLARHIHVYVFNG